MITYTYDSGERLLRDCRERRLEQVLLEHGASIRGLIQRMGGSRLSREEGEDVYQEACRAFWRMLCGSDFPLERDATIMKTIARRLGRSHPHRRVPEVL
jgi:DNA-directed RNA polymerase specialized sigma24 family protein